MRTYTYIFYTYKLYIIISRLLSPNIKINRVNAKKMHLIIIERLLILLII